MKEVTSLYRFHSYLKDNKKEHEYFDYNFDKTEEIDIFLEIHKLIKFIQE